MTSMSFSRKWLRAGLLLMSKDVLCVLLGDSRSISRSRRRCHRHLQPVVDSPPTSGDKPGYGVAPAIEGRNLPLWRTARAKWEIAQFEPENLGRDLPKEVESMHCDEDQNALLAYLLHPAESLQDLSRKLITFRDEDGRRFNEADEIVAALAEDASELAIEGSKRSAKHA